MALTLLPNEIKKLKIQKKKGIFYPNSFTFILQENNNIRLDRKRLFSIINKSNNTKIEKNGLKRNINSMVFCLKIYQF